MGGEDLAGALTVELGAEVTNLRHLSGGASRETWAFDVGGRGLILQRERPGRERLTVSVPTQAGLLRTAADRGVPVPRVAASGESLGGAGGAFMVLERIDGETIPRKILRDERFAGARARLTAQSGEALARIHAIPPEAVSGLERQDPLAAFRKLLDDLGQPHAAFELGFRWLEANRPPAAREAVCHGDFRLGNLIVGPEGLRAVIDWELAHLGDPVEDLGWLCVKSWRYGGRAPVGGVGTYQELLDAYERASSVRVEAETLRWWEVMGTLRWGVICIVQAMTHLSGAARSVELAAIGRRVCEVEHDLLSLLP